MVLASLARRFVPEALKPGVRGLRHVVETIGFREHTVSVEVLGEPLALIIADRAAKSWYARTLSPAMLRELAFLREHMVRRGDVVFEAGAHHGFMTILLGRWVGDEGRVVAFEANPSMRRCSSETCA